MTNTALSLYFHTAHSDQYTNAVEIDGGMTSDAASDYGDYQIKKEVTTTKKYADAATDAQTWMRKVVKTINDSKVYATVLSDFCILEGTTGYQSVMYNAYDSDRVELMPNYTSIPKTAATTTATTNAIVSGAGLLERLSMASAVHTSPKSVPAFPGSGA